MSKYVLIVILGIVAAVVIIMTSPDSEPDKIILSIGTLILSFMTFISSRDNANVVKETKKTVEDTAHAVNGALVGRVAAAGELGEARGRDIGRAEATKATEDLADQLHKRENPGE